MGIKQLAKLLSDEAPECIKEAPLASLNGRKIAIDASMAIYQFLIAVRQGGEGQAYQQLTNEAGETTSHIQGMFNRTSRFLKEGIKPVYVFDGKPPSLKSGELLKRREKREKAESDLKSAKEEGDIDKQNQQEKRLVRAGTKENDDCKKLLRLMGCPVVEAPCEAEAQCAALCAAGQVYASATEDMDCLTFKTPTLLRKMTFAAGKAADVQVITYDKIISGLAITHDMFVDLCILMGCDYCDSIKGIGPKTALKLIREHKCIENILKNIDREKHEVPRAWVPFEDAEEEEEAVKEEKSGNVKEEEEEEEEEAKEEVSENSATEANTTTSTSSASPVKSAPADPTKTPKIVFEKIEPVYVQARRLFNHHEVLIKPELKWESPKAEELKKFLCDEMGFQPERVDGQIANLQKAFKANARPQMRMDSFFGVKKAPNADIVAKKRQTEKDAAKGSKGKKAKAKGFFGKK